jgi:hypothetical protein
MNTITDILPELHLIQFTRPDNTSVTIMPKTDTIYEFTYSNHPNSRPTLISACRLETFFTKNPHILHALNNPHDPY